MNYIRIFLNVMIIACISICAMDQDNTTFQWHETRAITRIGLVRKIKITPQGSTQEIGCIEYTCQKNSALLDDLSVDTEYQKRGLGTELMLKMFDYLQINNIHQVSWAPTHASISFYERFGARYIKEYGTFEFDFNRDGDPRQNVLNYSMKKK